MEYVKLALLIIQLLNAMKEKEKGKGVSVQDIARVAETAESMGLIKSSELKDAKEDISLIQQLVDGIGGLFDGDEEDKPKKAPAVVPFNPNK